MRHAVVNDILESVSRVILGKHDACRLALACILARGHLLIEDLPGMGKTTLANTFARVLGLEFGRIQFTSDLLPADIVGFSMPQGGAGDWIFKPGPVFTNVLVADEINRASPRTQSALLEAMEECQVTVDRDTHALPSPFFVVATQNPLGHLGTLGLPESQLDRFGMRISLGYPDRKVELELLKGNDGRSALGNIKPLMDASSVLSLQHQVREVFISERVLDYIHRVVDTTRRHERIALGISPRGAIALAQCGRALAFIDGRDHVLPDHVQQAFVPVCAHRLILKDSRARDTDIARSVLEAVDVL